MRDLARNCISVIQHNLLGDLFVRLWPLLWLSIWFARDQGQDLPVAYAGGALAGIVILLCVIWLLGFLAIHERPKGQGALERVQDAPRNSFEVWSKVPPGGLRPPRLTRAVVETLGRPASQLFIWIDRLALAFCLAAAVFLIVAHYSSPKLAPAGPLLADPAVHRGLFLCLAAYAVASVVRSWAVDRRGRLATDLDSPAPTGAALRNGTGGE